MITVPGEGRIAARPDCVTVQIGVEAEAGQAAEAQAKASQSMASVITALRALGVADRDLATLWISLGPRYEDRPDGGAPHLIGYQATQTLRVRSSDHGRTGPLIDAAVAGGASQIQGISLSIEDRAAAEAQARAAAVADARARAETIAEAAGMRLGRPRVISEVGGAVFPPVRPSLARLAAVGDSAATPLEAGDEEVVVRIEASFELD